MAETLALIPASPADGSATAPLDLEAARSRLMELREVQSDRSDSCEVSGSEAKKLMEELASDFRGIIKEVEMEEANIAALEPQDLDAFLEQLRNEIASTEEENKKFSIDIDDLTRELEQESITLDGELESLGFSLSLIDSQGLNVISYTGDAYGSLRDVPEDSHIEILKLEQQIEKMKDNLNVLQELDVQFKRTEALGQIVDKLSQVRVLEFEGNCIRLSLKTIIPSSDGLLLQHKLDLVEPSVVEHELLMEVVPETLELRKAEIFPNDVPLDDIVCAVRSSSHISVAMAGPTLECLVRQVQYRVLLCSLRRLLLRDAKKSRHSFEFSDRDETITAHLAGEIDAFIKIPQSWPISDTGLKLVSIKSSKNQSKVISLSFLHKIKELANSLNSQTRGHLVHFMDAIEELLVQEMHSEVHPNGRTT